MAKKIKPPPERPSQIEWLLNERRKHLDDLVCCLRDLEEIPFAPRETDACVVAKAVLIAATEYEEIAAAMLIAAHQVYQYSNAVRMAAQEEVSIQCTPSG